MVITGLKICIVADLNQKTKTIFDYSLPASEPFDVIRNSSLIKLSEVNNSSYSLRAGAQSL